MRDKAFVLVNVYCPHKEVTFGHVENHTVFYLVVLKWVFCKVNVQPFLVVTLVVLVACRRCESSIYTLGEHLALRSGP